jgi:hypothetical protein
MRAVEADRRSVPEGLRVVHGPDDLETTEEPEPEPDA